MPIYEFSCEECRDCFEQLVFANDDQAVSCPKCGSVEVKKQMSCSSFIGTGGSGSCGPGAPGGFS